ncbi:MAG: zinc-ribbon domain-containing protein [Ruminococcaceae bacterium]|nr:zinc-ribbon domain-containing protein [Oscillospiraceae bacterium]
MSGILAVFAVIAFVIALVFSIICFVVVLPEKQYSSLNPFLKAVADIFNFKSLLIEKILKFFYLFSTVFIIVYGFFSMFSGDRYTNMFLPGLLTMILGPIILRLSYEFLMMIVLLVKNVIEINKKLSNKAETTVTYAAEPIYAQEPASAPVLVCPNCGSKLDNPDMAFCTKCGARL